MLDLPVEEQMSDILLTSLSRCQQLSDQEGDHIKKDHIKKDHCNFSSMCFLNYCYSVCLFGLVGLGMFQ